MLSAGYLYIMAWLPICPTSLKLVHLRESSQYTKLANSTAFSFYRLWEVLIIISRLTLVVQIVMRCRVRMYPCVLTGLVLQIC